MGSRKGGLGSDAAGVDGQLRWRKRMLMVLMSFVCISLAVIRLAGWHGWEFNRCLFRAVIGVDCPACGVTHSVGYALVGNLRQSCSHNPAGPLLAFLLLAGLAYMGLAVLFGKKSPITWNRECACAKAADACIAVILVGVWGLRMCSH